MNKLRFAGVVLLAASTSLAAVDPALLNLAMPDAKGLSGLQVDQSQASPFGQYILSQMQTSDEGYQKLVSATGFDPRRDLHEIVAANTGVNNVLVLGRGAFQPALISAAAAAAGGTVTKYRGFDVLSPPGPSPGISLAFLDATMAAIGPADLVKAAIDRRISGAVFSGPMAQTASAASTGNDAWFVTLSPFQFLSGNLGDPNLNQLTQGNVLQAVLQVSGGVQFGADAVNLTADAVTASNQNAQALVDVMKFLAGMASSNNPKLGALANVATFTANGPVMHLTLALPEQLIEQLFMPPAARTKKAVRARQ